MRARSLTGATSSPAHSWCRTPTDMDPASGVSRGIVDWPAGHSVRVEEDAEIVLFSSHHAHLAVIDHMKAKLASMA